MRAIAYYGRKKFYNDDTWFRLLAFWQLATDISVVTSEGKTIFVIKLFTAVSYELSKKLERLSLASLSSLVY